MNLESERLILREWEEKDHLPFVQMNSDPLVMKYFPKLLTREESEQFITKIQNHFQTFGYGLWVLETKRNKEFLGFTGFMNVTFSSFFTPSIEIGWRLHPSFWSRGYATEAASTCLQHGFSRLKFSEIVSFTSILNERSQSVMKRIGMKEVGFFAHPNLPKDHVLSEHVLYKISVPEWSPIGLKSTISSDFG
ncbi:GCN5 family acetyltransferase [Leptospira tipperaryensis]|uniref:GCN5 family acetyltransferase n=1 Tax=Leptospira tipperaryensis TaxID=2564040 RepID=A0A1D7UTN7_9LEPT|nr:GNAT family N-acetyltransferase [Leptospira tipperaryensis]AOP32977.1 GCN5 family acetyltransferase [Leptospira tipperaryensis]